MLFGVFGVICYFWVPFPRLFSMLHGFGACPGVRNHLALELLLFHAKIVFKSIWGDVRRLFAVVPEQQQRSNVVQEQDR